MNAERRDLTCLYVSDLGVVPYELIWQRMRKYTEQRTADSIDQLWLLEHDAVYTQGVAGKSEHLLDPGDIPVIATDRGGQVTYHGPGQLILYPLIDLARLKLGIRQMIDLLEESVIELLSYYSVKGHLKSDAPGVYVDEKKIASLGLRVKKGRCFHGVSINISMSLAPFDGINPCGYEGLEMTRLIDCLSPGKQASMKELNSQITDILARRLGLTPIPHQQECL